MKRRASAERGSYIRVHTYPAAKAKQLVAKMGAERAELLAHAIVVRDIADAWAGRP